MDDLISRQKAINVFEILADKMTDEGQTVMEQAISVLRDLPFAEPERKWISITEKLPWTDTNVLVTVLDDSGDTSWSYTSVGWLTPDGKYWVVDNEVCYGVIAWMPLPEPWRSD